MVYRTDSCPHLEVAEDVTIGIYQNLSLAKGKTQIHDQLSFKQVGNANLLNLWVKAMFCTPWAIGRNLGIGMTSSGAT